MSAPSFTPGPWEVVDRGHGANIEPSIAWIGYGSAHEREEYKANARLIAAAPDMLEALKSAAIVLRCIEKKFKPTLDEVTKAIAKAEGCEP